MKAAKRGQGLFSTGFLPVLYVLILSLAILGCSGGDGGGNDSSRQSKVYIAGWVQANADSSLTVPVYWQGQGLVRLSVMNPACDGRAYSIVAQGDAIHVAGFTAECSAGTQVKEVPTAAYWLKGERTDLPKPAAYSMEPSAAYQMALANGSVYIAGYVTGAGGLEPVYWKDGGIVALQVPTGAKEAIAYNLYIDGTDVYASGVARYDHYYPVYWKNGVPRILPSPSGYVGRDRPYPVTVSNGDVYVFGTLAQKPFASLSGHILKPVYWKNNEMASLMPFDNKDGGAAGSGTVNKGTVYSAGHFDEVNSLYSPSLWIGQTMQLLPLADNSRYGVAKDVFVESGQIYVAGNYAIDHQSLPGKHALKPCYWVNGNRADLETLQPGTGQAVSLFVLP